MSNTTLDKVVLITGASSGIGAASADNLHSLQAEFGADNALTVEGDVTRSDVPVF